MASASFGTPKGRINAVRLAHQRALGNPFDSTQPEHALVLANAFLVIQQWRSSVQVMAQFAAIAFRRPQIFTGPGSGSMPIQLPLMIAARAGLPDCALAGEQGEWFSRYAIAHGP
jgi:hypothetical protein